MTAEPDDPVLPANVRALLADLDRLRPFADPAHQQERLRTARGELLPPADPHEYLSHGQGFGPLDGLEEWGQPWGSVYLRVLRTGGGGGATWCVHDRHREAAVFASGHCDTVEKAGEALLALCKHRAVSR